MVKSEHRTSYLMQDHACRLFCAKIAHPAFLSFIMRRKAYDGAAEKGSFFYQFVHRHQQDLRKRDKLCHNTYLLTYESQGDDGFSLSNAEVMPIPAGFCTTLFLSFFRIIVR